MQTKAHGSGWVSGRRFRILCMTAGAVSVIATVASAQEDRDQEVLQLEEVVVTAQKREEKLQEVPQTLYAVTASQLEDSGISGSRDLTQLVPGLNIVQTAFVPHPVIRGVGTRGVGPGDESTVPIYVDGVYVSMQSANAFDLSNVERIEVLKGPQGTLFGRNAVGGAINILTKDPGDVFEGRISASYGSFNKRTAEAYLSGPLSDTLAANLVVYGSADDGYIDDLINGGKANPASTTIARGKLVWNPDDLTEFKLSANYTFNIDGSGVMAHPINGVTRARTADPPVLIPGPFQFASDRPVHSKFFTEGVSLQGRRSLPGFDLTGIGSYQYSKMSSSTDSDSTAFVGPQFSDLVQRDQAYTGEIRATSNGDGPFQWIFGTYYFNAKTCYCDNINTGIVLTPTQRSDAYAVFGEATYDLSDRLTVTGGLRYSYEERSIYTIRSGAFLGDDDATFSKVSPRLSATYALSDRARVYFTYSEGFKSGVYNSTSTLLPLTPVDPEILKAYEVGFKSEPRSWLRLNGSAFYYDYTDLQVLSFNIVTNSTLLQNAASAEMYGGELSIDMAATSRWNIYAGASYTHAEFLEFPGANVTLPRPDLAGTMNVRIDAAGKTVPRTPEFTLSLRSDYEVPLEFGSLKFAGNLYYASDAYYDFGNVHKAEAYTAINAKATWTSPSEQYRVSTYVENLTDSDRLLALSTNAAAIAGVEVRPRSYGIKLEYSF